MKLDKIKESKYGFASVIICIIVVIVGVIISYQDIQDIFNEKVSFSKTDLYITYSLIIGNIIGVILGIVGVAKKEKHYAIDGLILNGILFVKFIILQL